MADMSIFQGASHIIVNGDVSTNTTSGHYINKSRQNITNNYGSQNVSQTNYVNSNNDHSSHHHHTSYGAQTTVNNVNSNNTTQTSYVNSNNDHSNTMYGDWRGYPQYPQQQGPPQGWPPRGQGQDYTDSYRSHPGMTQYDPQADGYPSGGEQLDPSQNLGPYHAGNYQQQGYGPDPSKRPHQKKKNNRPNGFEPEQNQRHSYAEAEFLQHQHFQHVQPRPASFHAAPAPNSSSYSLNYTADFSQQHHFEQNSVPHTGDYSTPRGQQEDWTEPSGPASGEGSNTKKEKRKDKDKKGKKPQRATVETTDDEDDHPPAKSTKDGERERMVNQTLGPVLERINDTDDDFGDLLQAPPPRHIRPASVPVQSTSTITVTGTGTQGTASQQRPTSTNGTVPTPAASTSQSASGRPAVAATASAPLPGPHPLASSTSGAAATSNAGRVSSGPTTEEKKQAKLAVDPYRRSSTSSSSDDGKDKKKKKGVFSRIKAFGKKKEKGGVVGLGDINIG